MKINQKAKGPKLKTHEGAPAVRIDVRKQLERTICSCFLGENEFYENGVQIKNRISDLAAQCETEYLADLAIKTRQVDKLRHAPLLLLLELLKRGGEIVSRTMVQVLQRPDQLGELYTLFMGGPSRGTGSTKKPIPHQMKKGFAAALAQFDEYQMAKWEGEGDRVKLRDILRLSRAKPPKGKEGLYKKLREGTLARPNTWESRVVSGENKKEVFTDLLSNRKLPYMALLRNLRLMQAEGVDPTLIKSAILNPGPSVLPFRFIAAVRAAPAFVRELDTAMQKTLENARQLVGPTVLLVDVSDSMNAPLSQKSDLTRMDAACGLAILLSGICPDLRIFTFSYKLVEVAPVKGLALHQLIVKSQPHRGTELGGAVQSINDHLPGVRLIVITDEQARSPVPDPKTDKAYMINVASAQNGVGYGKWTHIDGFSENCVNFIQEFEALES